MKFLLNLRLMHLLGILFEAVPNAGSLNGAWAKGYTLLRALYDFIAHFKGGTPTVDQLEQVLADAQAEAAAAEAPAPVPAQVPPAGPVSDDTLAPRAVIEV